MNSHVRTWGWTVLVLAACLPPAVAPAGPATTQPVKVYVPYEKLKGVFETEKQGVFLPYEEFRRLWREARRAPAEVVEAPTPYLVSTSRFTGKVDAELASMQLELTVDVLADGWVEVPIGLADVAVAAVRFVGPGGKPAKGPEPLLRVVKGRYVLLTRGKGRRVLVVEFVRQLVTKPGLNVLGFQIPASAITTFELTIPEENMKVDVEPMLAASTEQVAQAGKKATRLRAFLGSARTVKLSWKPKTQAAADLAPVVISDQQQHIDVGEALISHEVKFTYDIRRRGVDSFTIQLPGGFRVTSVEGSNIARWDIDAGAPGRAQELRVRLFSPVKDSYALTVKMELFLKEAQTRVALSPILTRQVLRRSGLVAVTHSPRRSVELVDARNLARVDTGRLPKALRARRGVTAWRFITADYGGALAIGTVAPRITASHLWALGVDSDRLELRGRLAYQIERAGVFRLSLNLPEPWEVVSIGPAALVDDHQLSGNGPGRTVNILLKREVTGSITLELAARADRATADAPVDFRLPLADRENLRLYSGQVLVLLADRLRAEEESRQQLQPLPLNRASRWVSLPGLSPAMALEFRSIDPAKPAGARLKVAVKPPQVSAAVHRLVDIQPGSVEEQAVVEYRVLYAPVDTFYVQMPATLANEGVRLSGRDIKEKPRLDALPAGLRAAKPTTRPGVKVGEWAYYKIVLQSPVTDRYRLTVSLRRSFQADTEGKTNLVDVLPILAAGKLSDQVGYVAVAKADTLAIGEPTVKENLIDGDPTSAADLPEAAHRKVASLAYRCNAPPFALVLPVTAQKEAAVFTTLVTGAVIEQVIGRNREINTHATFLLKTSRGDRLSVKLPPGGDYFSVLLNGAEAPTEDGPTDEEKIVRLPPSAGQVARLVLEVRYGLKDASLRRLSAPQLPEGIPIQQTLWRLRIPSEDYLLWHSPAFRPLDGGERQLRMLAAGYPGKVAFQFAPQGRTWDFVRHGAPGELRIWLARRETFSIAVWAAILLVGIAALKLTGFQRCVLVLLAAVGVLLLRLFAPELVKHLLWRGQWAGLIVLGLWVAHWLLKRLPRQIAERRAKPSAEPAVLAPAAPRPAAPPPTPGEGPQADEGPQDQPGSQAPDDQEKE